MSYSSKENPDFYEGSGFEFVKNDYGMCLDCSKPNTNADWCHTCNAERFRQNFGNWTSGNEHIDKFIQYAQLDAMDKREVLEWIPYEKLKHVTYVAKGGYSTIYKAIWIDGPITGWDNETQQWERYKFIYGDKCEFLTTIDNIYTGTFGLSVALKCLHDSSNVGEDFLNEWKTHLKCYKASNFSLIRLIGITKDPETSNYMVAMEYAANGSLRDELKSLIQKNCDLGLSQPVNKSTSKGEVYGILPYVAPEVLKGELYTPAADVYSFGMIMWELTSGRQPFDDFPYDMNLYLKIIQGIRPKIVENTPKSYALLMKKCWDSNPLERPTALKLKETLGIWKKKCSYYYYDEEEEKTFEEDDDDNNDDEICKATLEFREADENIERRQNYDEPKSSRHPEAYNSSRLISFPGINFSLSSQVFTASLAALTLDETIEELGDEDS
ncbi:kinase-like domain-containing protein [Gigaspora rosea]|uniref:Kinase-like domain-containing protein n=1 Tax=Gigaspora rosea TaxID=44941 RepID=A0A397VD56_9GLOM|nr:kinase-like domain-containing protein [Gigaspora rosea]